MLPPSDVSADLTAVVGSVPGIDGQLTPVDTDMLHLRLANFGAVSLPDAHLVRQRLEHEVSQWPPMRFRIDGGAVLDPMGDDSAWAELDGDTEQLAHIADLTVKVVKRLGFLVDRRLSRTRIRVGRITKATTTDFLERLVDRLDGYTSREWVCDALTLVRIQGSPGGGPGELEVAHQLPLLGSSRIGEAPVL